MRGGFGLFRGKYNHTTLTASNAKSKHPLHLRLNVENPETLSCKSQQISPHSNSKNLGLSLVLKKLNHVCCQAADRWVVEDQRCWQVRVELL